MNQHYSLRDVTSLLKLKRSVVCGFIDAGFVTPVRGARREYRFSFQDLVLLKTAQGLADADVSSTRILRALRRLRSKLPGTMPAGGLRIEAVGNTIVVNDGKTQWQANDGQYLLRFAVEPAARSVKVVSAGRPSTTTAQRSARRTTQDWFAAGEALETENASQAMTAYRRAIENEPGEVAAYINLSRLLHTRRRLAEAEAVCREGAARCGPEPTLLFNLAVILEDLKKPLEAIDVYDALLKLSPQTADAHYNLALLCESCGLPQRAVRHLSAFRRLTRKS
ncbi:MAG TPA: tetratricopeptide repeat protein [Casimicrobiaceae bacterium]|nr:tetratricopeptide repeat protein [Casimicrobiaceae bacterium]